MEETLSESITRKIIVGDLLVSYIQIVPTPQLTTCLFLHGWRSQAAVFLPLMKMLAVKGIASYAIDLPGFGASQIPNHKFTLTDYCLCINEFVKKLNLSIGCLIGHSFGGRIAIKIASQKTQIATKLVLIDSAGIIEHKMLLTAMKQAAKIIKPIFRPKFMKPLRQKLYQFIGADDYLATPQLRETYLEVIKDNLIGLLPNIKSETLLIWGNDDKDTPIPIGFSMKRLIPNSKLEIIPDAGHFSFLDQPNTAAILISEFITAKEPIKK